MRINLFRCVDIFVSESRVSQENQFEVHLVHLGHLVLLELLALQPFLTYLAPEMM